MCLGMNPDILAAGRALRLDLEPQLRGPPGRRRPHAPRLAGDGRRAPRIAGRFTDVRELAMRELRAGDGPRGGARPRRRRHRPDHPEAVPEADRALRVRRVPLLRLDEGSRLRAAPARVRGRADPRRRAQLRLRLLARARGVGARGLRLPGRSSRRASATSSARTRSRPASRRSSCRRRRSTQIKAAVAARNELTVDLEALEISHPDGLRVPFELDEYARETLLHGLDDVARTLKREERDRGLRSATSGPVRHARRRVALTRGARRSFEHGSKRRRTSRALGRSIVTGAALRLAAHQGIGCL